jgi:hypothetical protein
MILSKVLIFTKKSNIVNKIYPFFSMGVIQAGTLLENSSNLITLFVFLIQVLIGVLTVIKLYKEIKINKTKKTDEQIESEIKKKNRFLFSLLSVLKNFKSK